MKAYAIFMFILAIHAALAMINYADITNAGLNLTVDTSTRGQILYYNNETNISLRSSDFFNESANGTNISIISQRMNSSSFSGNTIESIIGFATTFTTLIGTFKDIIFSIHALCAPIFGNFNAWVIEAIVDVILFIALFQMVTGRSFKTME